MGIYLEDPACSRQTWCSVHAEKLIIFKTPASYQPPPPLIKALLIEIMEDEILRLDIDGSL